jgi:hypothetical protein
MLGFINNNLTVADFAFEMACGAMGIVKSDAGYVM